MQPLTAGFCVSFPTPRHSWCLTWQALHDFIEITPVHGKSNPSLSQQLRLLQRKAGETQEWRQSQRNLSQKGCSREIFTRPRHLEADVCTQTQHFTSVHSLIGFPGLPHFNLMVLPPKRHPSQLRAGEKSLKAAQVELSWKRSLFGWCCTHVLPEIFLVSSEEWRHQVGQSVSGNLYLSN